MEFHAALRHHLLRRGITRAELLAFLIARCAERGEQAPSKATVNRWFAGTAIPNLHHALDLAVALEVRIDQLSNPAAIGEPAIDTSADDDLVRGICSYLGSEATLRRLLLLEDRDACVCAGRK